MADNRIQMPSGMGGLIRYSEGTSTKLSLKPEHVLALVLFVIIAEIILQIL